MKHLFLLRHAKSSWEGPGLPDHDRPLAPRGRRAARVVADHLRRQRLAAEVVLCSSARRTQETWELVAPGLGGEPDVRVERGLYGAGCGELLARLRQVPDEVGSVLLIGHNPAIQELALSLAGQGPEIERARRKFPTGALATLAFDSSWGELAPGGATLTAFVKPKELD